jgi:hypothetical protein
MCHSGKPGLATVVTQTGPYTYTYTCDAVLSEASGHSRTRLQLVQCTYHAPCGVRYLHAMWNCAQLDSGSSNCKRRKHSHDTSCTTALSAAAVIQLPSAAVLHPWFVWSGLPLAHTSERIRFTETCLQAYAACTHTQGFGNHTHTKQHDPVSLLLTQWQNTWPSMNDISVWPCRLTSLSPTNCQHSCKCHCTVTAHPTLMQSQKQHVSSWYLLPQTE